MRKKIIDGRDDFLQTRMKMDAQTKKLFVQFVYLDVLLETAKIGLKFPLGIRHLLLLLLGVGQLLLSRGELSLLGTLLLRGVGQVALVTRKIALLCLDLSHHGLLVGSHLFDLPVEPVPHLNNLVVGFASNSCLLFKSGDLGLHVNLANEPLGPVDKEVPGPVAEEQVLFHVPDTLDSEFHEGDLFKTYLCMTGIISLL